MYLMDPWVFTPNLHDMKFICHVGTLSQVMALCNESSLPFLDVYCLCCNKIFCDDYRIKQSWWVKSNLLVWNSTCPQALPQTFHTISSTSNYTKPVEIQKRQKYRIKLQHSISSVPQHSASIYLWKWFTLTVVMVLYCLNRLNKCFHDNMPICLVGNAFKL